MLLEDIVSMETRLVHLEVFLINWHVLGADGSRFHVINNIYINPVLREIQTSII